MVAVGSLSSRQNLLQVVSVVCVSLNTYDLSLTGSKDHTGRRSSLIVVNNTARLRARATSK